MKYCLITPIVKPRNPGWDMITLGIRFIISHNDKNASFVEFNMYDQNVELPNCDRFVICGNPRYDSGSESGGWLYEGLIRKLLQKKIPIIDAWQGSGFPLGFTNEENLSLAIKIPRNKNIAKLLKGQKIIARDNLTKKINQFFNLDSILLPCSSFFAAKQENILPAKIKTEKIVVAYNLEGYESGTAILRTLSRTHRVIATMASNVEFCEKAGIKYDAIFDYKELLELYSKCKEVLSYRLHAAIPAASLGAKVLCFAIDSRAEACSLFNIPFVDYRNGAIESALCDNKEIPNIKEVLQC